MTAKQLYWIVCFALIGWGITRSTPAPLNHNSDFIDPGGHTIETRFLLPPGYSRTSENINSFADYLRKLPLKAHGSKVVLYNGTLKEKQNVYDAVVDLPIGRKDLHQCADACIRLRADYLYSIKKYDAIHFNFTNGMRVDYSEWMKGKRIVVEGNKTYWKQTAAPSNTPEDFWNYLEKIFTYAGTASLAKEMSPIQLNDIKIGDVFIRGGSPGHAVIVVDMAEDANQNKIFLLAQSYMPAQEIQVLKNPNNPNHSPWYDTKFGTTLITPEWTFDVGELKRFKE